MELLDDMLKAANPDDREVFLLIIFSFFLFPSETIIKIHVLVLLFLRL